jgi:hypothetical protein
LLKKEKEKEKTPLAQEYCVEPCEPLNVHYVNNQITESTGRNHPRASFVFCLWSHLRFSVIDKNERSNHSGIFQRALVAPLHNRRQQHCVHGHQRTRFCTLRSLVNASAGATGNVMVATWSLNNIATRADGLVRGPSFAQTSLILFITAHFWPFCRVIVGPMAMPQQLLNGQVATCLYYWCTTSKLEKLMEEHTAIVSAAIGLSISVRKWHFKFT